MLSAQIDQRLRTLPGLNVEAARSLRRESSKRIAQAPPLFAIELGDLLLDRGSIFHRFIAYELIHYHRAALASLKSADLERLGQVLAKAGQ